MDFSTFISVPIVVVCLIVGYIIKHLVSDETIQNKYIPVIVTCLGIIISLVLAVTGGDAVTSASLLNAVIAGGISGASSTGFQSAFAAFVETPKAAPKEDAEDKDEDSKEEVKG